MYALGTYFRDPPYYISYSLHVPATLTWPDWTGLDWTVRTSIYLFIHTYLTQAGASAEVHTIGNLPILLSCNLHQEITQVKHMHMGGLNI